MTQATKIVLVGCSVLVVVFFSALVFYLYAMHQPAGNYTGDISMSSFCNVLTLTSDGQWFQSVKSESSTGPNYVKQQQAKGTWTRTGPEQVTFSPGLYDDALSPSHTTSVAAKLNANGIGPELSWPVPRTPFSRVNPVIRYHKPLTGNTSCPFFQLH